MSLQLAEDGGGPTLSPPETCVGPSQSALVDHGRLASIVRQHRDFGYCLAATLDGYFKSSGRLPPASQNHDRNSDASGAFIDFRAGPIEVCDSRSIAIPAPSPSDGAGFRSRWRVYALSGAPAFFQCLRRARGCCTLCCGTACCWNRRRRFSLHITFERPDADAKHFSLVC